MEHRPVTHDEPVDRGSASVAEVTARMSKIVADGGMREPDVIREGPGPYEVSFIWEEEKSIVIVDRREDAGPS